MFLLMKWMVREKKPKHASQLHMDTLLFILVQRKKQRVDVNYFMLFFVFCSIRLSFGLNNFHIVPNMTSLQDVYFDDESAEEVISSLHLVDDQDR